MKGWHQIFFHDPEGNVIEVHQIMSESGVPTREPLVGAGEQRGRDREQDCRPKAPQSFCAMFVKLYATAYASKPPDPRLRA